MHWVDTNWTMQRVLLDTGNLGTSATSDVYEQKQSFISQDGITNFATRRYTLEFSAQIVLLGVGGGLGGVDSSAFYWEDLDQDKTWIFCYHMQTILQSRKWYCSTSTKTNERSRTCTRTNREIEKAKYLFADSSKRKNLCKFHKSGIDQGLCSTLIVYIKIFWNTHWWIRIIKKIMNRKMKNKRRRRSRG